MSNNEQLKPAQEESILKGLAEQLLNKEINQQDFLGALKELEQPANDNSTQKKEINTFLDELDNEDIETVLKQAPFDNYLETNFELYDDDFTSPQQEQDKVFLEIPKGGLSLVCGATGHGKTFFLNQLLLDLVHKHQNKTFYFISYEENKENIYLKLFLIYLSNYRIVDEFSKNHLKTLKHYFKILLQGKAGNKLKFVTKKDQDLKHLEKNIEQAFKDFKELSNRIKVIKPKTTDTQHLIALMQAIQERKGDNTGGFLIDYVQLLQPNGEQANTRQEELKKICYNLQEVSQSLNCGLILGCQFNRYVNNPLDLHASKISEAGDIERNASLIIGLYDLNRKMIIDKKEKKAVLINQLLQYLGFNNKDQELPLKPYLYIELLKNRNGNPNLKSLIRKNNNTGKIDKYFKQ